MNKGQAPLRSRRQVVGTSVPPHLIEALLDGGLEERLNLLDELLNTEEEYVKDLNVIVQRYYNPVKEAEWLSAEDREIIFSNIETLYEIHKHLYDELQKSINDISKANQLERCIVNTFNEFAPELKHYVAYSTMYKDAFAAIQRLKRDSPEFLAYYKKTANVDAKKLVLDDYLIKPIQRLCKYPLLFKSMMEYTPENHADYPYIAQSRETLEKVTNYVNEKQREWERIQPLMEVKERISSCDVEIIEPKRGLIMEASVTIAYGNMKRPEMRTLFLFSDMFVLTKAKGDKDSVTTDFCWQVVSMSRKNKFTFFAHKDRERTRMVNAFQKAIVANNAAYKKSLLSSSRPANKIKKRVDGDDINKGVKGKHRRSRSSEVGVPSESAVTDSRMWVNSSEESTNADPLVDGRKRSMARSRSSMPTAARGISKSPAQASTSSPAIAASANASLSSSPPIIPPSTAPVQRRKPDLRKLGKSSELLPSRKIQVDRSRKHGERMPSVPPPELAPPSLPPRPPRPERRPAQPERRPSSAHSSDATRPSRSLPGSRIEGAPTTIAGASPQDANGATRVTTRGTDGPVETKIAMPSDIAAERTAPSAEKAITTEDMTNSANGVVDAARERSNSIKDWKVEVRVLQLKLERNQRMLEDEIAYSRRLEMLLRENGVVPPSRGTGY